MAYLSARECAEQTIDGTLPYEETWLENARNVVRFETALREIRMLTVEIGDSVEAATRASVIALEALDD